MQGILVLSVFLVGQRKIDATDATTSEAVIDFMQRKSIGHFRKKQGLHST